MVLTIEPSDVHDSYNTCFTIYRASRPLNSAGGTPKVWSVVGSNIRGRATHKLNRERWANEKRTERLSESFYCDPWVDVQRGDVIRTSAPASGVKTILVEHVDMPANIWSHLEIVGKAFSVGDKEVPGFSIPEVT